jgi:anti-sigma factor NepR-like protein
MPKKAPGKPRKRTTKPAPPPSATSSRAAAATAERYIAAQLKATYDAVAAEPIPDRLLELLDRLGRGEEK